MTTTYYYYYYYCILIIVISFNPLAKTELGMSSGNYQLNDTANRKSKIHARTVFL